MTTTPPMTTVAAAGPEPDDLYARSYLVMRFAIAVAGLTMPVFVIAGTWLISGEGRGSLSAYYHGPMRDFFVGALWAIGLLLITYKVTEPRSIEFRVSSVTGLGAVMLSFFPTLRPGPDPHGCENLVDGRACTPIQQVLTEGVSFAVHLAATALFLGGTLAMCVVWARAARSAMREAQRSRSVTTEASKRFASRVYAASIAAIVAALVFQLIVVIPFDVPNGLLWVELVCIAAFGTSWLVKSRALLRSITRRRRGVPALSAP